MTPTVQDWNDPATVAEWIAGHGGSAATGRQEHLEIVLALLAQVQPRGPRVLDLGCGDGQVAELVLARLPDSAVVGIDGAAPMLEAAGARLAPYAGRVALYRRALEDATPLPDSPAPFDAAIAVQSVHHLDATGKAALFRWVAAQVRPGGLFVLSDRVRLPSAVLFPYERAVYEVRRRRLGRPPLLAGFGYAAHLRANALRGDRPDTVEDQLAWLRAAGFGEVTCFYRYVERAIFGGLRGPAGPPDTPDPADASGAMVDATNAAGGGGF